MANNKVLCTCSRCKKIGINNIGNYVHPTTKWRHEKKYNPTGNYEVGSLFIVMMMIYGTDLTMEKYQLLQK